MLPWHCSGCSRGSPERGCLIKGSLSPTQLSRAKPQSPAGDGSFRGTSSGAVLGLAPRPPPPWEPARAGSSTGCGLLRMGAPPFWSAQPVFMVPHVYVRMEMSPDFPKTSSSCASFQKFLQRKAGLATSPGSSFLSSLPSAIRSVLTLRELCNTSVHVLCCLC